LESLGLSESSIKIGGVMVFADGSLAAGTAALSSPYKDQPENMGKLFYKQDELADILEKIHRAGFQAVIHAMGDRAIEEALKAVEKALATIPKENHRHRIENAAVLNPKLITWMEKLGVTVSLQPYLIFSEFSVWSAMSRLGAERARWLYPLRTLIDKGIWVAGGSDCPMEPLNPFVQMKAAVARSVFPEEQITIEEALRMFTINAAYISFEENAKGSIEEGKLADLTVLSRNPLETSPEKLDSLKVEMTIIGGKIAYQRI
ncbi:amidohydrolase family protein, partial [Candidatus Bathyarchaeota archaeon]|nr:amidohydrolase family protein [Candidatus Bathyarchaeota archaeon]